MLFKVNAATLDLSSRDDEWGRLRWGGVRSRRSSWNGDKFRFANETKTFTEGQMQHIVPRDSFNFLRKRHIDNYNVSLPRNSFVPFLFFWGGGGMTGAVDPETNNNNLSKKLLYAQSWTVRFCSIKYRQSPTLTQRSYTNTLFHPDEGIFGWWISPSSKALWKTFVYPAKCLFITM